MAMIVSHEYIPVSYVIERYSAFYNSIRYAYKNKIKLLGFIQNVSKVVNFFPPYLSIGVMPINKKHCVPADVSGIFIF